MVFCPKCGKKFADNAEKCDSCGEILKEETSFKRFVKYYDSIWIISGILFFLLLILNAFDYNPIPSSYSLILIIVLMFITLIFGLPLTKNAALGFILSLIFGKDKRTHCPQCDNPVPHENFCLNCGYKLEDMMGYYQLGFYQPTFVEVNKNYIRVFFTYRDSHLNLSRNKPITYDLKHMEFPEIVFKGRIMSNPYLRFNYDSATDATDVKIDKKIAAALNQLFPNINGYENLGQAARQNRRNKAIILGIFLVLILSVSYLAAEKTYIATISSETEIDGLEIINATCYRATYIGTESVIIEGYVKNTGTKNLRYIDINATGLNSAGAKVDMQESYVKVSKDDSNGLDSLKPGEIGYFHITLYDSHKSIASCQLLFYQDEFWKNQ